MNQAAFHPASRREFQGAVQNRRFYGQKREGIRKEWVTSSSFGGWEGSMWQITSLVLAGKFQTDQLRLYSWGRLKLQLG